MGAKARRQSANGAHGALNLIKMCAGAETVAALEQWRAIRRAQLEREAAALRRAGDHAAADAVDLRPQHVTRMQPKRVDELLDGGSIYWVFKSVILARQRLEAIEPVIGEDGVTRHALIFAPEIVLTERRAQRPFQGWRYLKADDAPPDLGAGESVGYETADAALPSALRLAVAHYGVV